LYLVQCRVHSHANEPQHQSAVVVDLLFLATTATTAAAAAAGVSAVSVSAGRVAGSGEAVAALSGRHELLNGFVFVRQRVFVHNRLHP
jgi:hypothetical protein